MKVFEVLPCAEGAECLNSLDALGQGSAKCGVCRWSPDGTNSTSFWKPRDGKRKHPQAIEAKKVKAKAHLKELRVKRETADRARRKIQKKAEKAERLTESNYIKATKNSGRSNKDGDHTVGGHITVDTKLQTTCENPVVKLHELHKVRKDAKRAGNWIGCLTLRNRSDVGVVVMAEEDFAKLTAWLLKEDAA